uniref:H(+)-transporting two-sector ATPase n=1 Tax=Jakoba bahamiensis TaxID=221721 RepID=M4QL07_9EUKA|nr:ATP synthase F0 subunit 8 [Jakoba bahamiensis]AGH24138.1 ATP synthase F0 subunit 8 [Jakoba bahamiensis]
MPQLDKVTYLSQFFWLVFFFFSFYLILLKTMLPKIVTILKIRKKKIDSIFSEIHSYKKEESNILSNYDSLLKVSFSKSKSSIDTAATEGNNWVNSNLDTLNKKSFSNANQQYLTSIYNLGKEQIAFKKVNQLL